MSSFIYLRLSGGVGGCVVSDFRLVGGATGLAGELGHITVAGNDALCGCGKRGCVETLASVPALCERAGARDLSELRSAVHADDERALAAFEGAARAIGYVLGSAALLISTWSRPRSDRSGPPRAAPTSRPTHRARTPTASARLTGEGPQPRLGWGCALGVSHRECPDPLFCGDEADGCCM